MPSDKRIGWFVLILLLGLSAYAIAEDITLTTYYPSPRGVYQELRTQGDVGIGDIVNPPGARLHVTQTTANPAVHVTQSGAAPALRIDDQAGDLTPFVIDQDGNVGVGTAAPGAPLEVRSPTPPPGNTALRLVNAFSTPGIWELRSNSSPNDFIIWGGTSGGESERLRITQTGNVGIGTNAPAASALLDVSSTTQGFLPPRVTTAQRDAIAGPVNGLTVFNATTGKLETYNGGWVGGGLGYTGSAFPQSSCAGPDLVTTVGNFVNGVLIDFTSSTSVNDPACAGPPPPIY